MQRFLNTRGYLVLVSVLLLTILCVLIFFHEILFPFILACFLAYILAPIIAWINNLQWQGRKIPRGLAIIIVYLLILGSLISGGYYLIPRLSLEISQMMKDLPHALNVVTEKWIPVLNDRINSWVNLVPVQEKEAEKRAVIKQQPDFSAAGSLKMTESIVLEELFKKYVIDVKQLSDHHFEVQLKPKKTSSVERNVNLQEQWNNIIQKGVDRVKENTVQILNFGRLVLVKIAGSLFGLFLTLMISAFILVDVGRIERFIKSMFSSNYHQRVDNWLERLDKGLNGVVRGQLLICIINGVFTGIGLIWIGVPFAFMLSIIATVCSLIPIFGTFLSGFPIIIMALTVDLWAAVLVVGWILLVHFIEGNFLNPKIMGTSAEIHPALVVLSLIAGQYQAGFAGALLAVPIFSIMQNTFFFFQSIVKEMEEEAKNVSSLHLG